MSSTNLDPSSGPQREHRQPSPAEPAEVVDAQAEKLAAQIRALQQAGQRGANWFFWVAGLSVLNSLLIHSGAGIYFVVGMGLSLLADGLADHLSQQHPAQAVIFR